MNRKSFVSYLVALAALAAFMAPHSVQAQTTVTEDFTGTTSINNSWWYFNGACLTWGSASLVGSEPTSGKGQLPGCAAIGIGGSGPLYYNENLVGGQNGVSGSSQTLPDSAGSGALRFTNGSPGGYAQNGAIVSTTPFPTNQGVSITFKTVTYRGDSGGAGGDGADGISFYLLDSSKLNTSTITGVSSGDGNGLGSWGGSLGYTCSNANPPYNGLIGGYVAVGIDEFGNFLNGTNNTIGETGTSATGDNTATGGGYQPGRIGMRGAGSIAFNQLTASYGSNPGSTSLPYYPSSLATSCANGGGTYNSSSGLCESCGTGTTYNSGANQCESCGTGVTYNPTTNTCDSCASGTYLSGSNTCANCSSGSYNATTGNCGACASGTYNSSTNQCEVCASGSYNSSTGNCQSCTTGNYDSTTNKCESCTTGTYNSSTNQCQSCASGTYDSGTGECESCGTGLVYESGFGECCPSGDTYNSGTNKCKSASGTRVTATPATATSETNTTPAASSPVLATTATPIQPTSGSPQSPTGSSPSTAYPDSYYAVQNTCANGTLYNYATANNPQNAGAATLANSANTAKLLDYAAITTSAGGGAYVVLPTGTQIANESAMSRGAATPIYYQLTITPTGLLSLSYSVNNGSSYQPVISSQSITSSNGPLPSNFLFGFAGSTGGDTNIHEILCFKAAPATTSASSAGASQRQSSQLETGAQAFFAYYNPDNWTGTVTATALSTDSFNNIILASTPTWDAGCVLTGLASSSTTCLSTGATGPVAALPTPTNRVVLSWSGTAGIPFEYGNLTTGTSGQQATIDAGDSTVYAGNSAYTTDARVKFLRGDRTNELTSTGAGLFRDRINVVADIVDSSPTWVGPPLNTFPATWSDRLYTSATAGEMATGAQTYTTYASSSGEGGRLNVVYIGSNDGLLHGFRSGSFNANTGAFTYNSTTPNDGQEVLAYMPGAVVKTIHQYSNASASAAAAAADVDYSNSQYEHNFFVDATPGTGDLFYDKAWHSWVVGGLGPGGSAIYALDVSNPSNFSETHASSLVMGEWTPATITCANATAAPSCGNNLGNTYGTPVIRRLHDGNWGVIFGNGYGSSTGQAGIYVMVIPTSTTSTVPTPAFYYLSTKNSSDSTTSPNGIAYAAAADLDGDHITDYVYAGDLKGNIWRFDLTSQTETNWGVSPGPLFTTPSGQPISTNLVIAAGNPLGGSSTYVMVLFGTGKKTPLTETSPATYASGTQSLYGVWDWNLSATDGGISGPGSGNPAGWDGIAGVPYASLTRAASGLSSPYTLTQTNLTQQIVTINANGNRDIASNATVCWKGTSACSANNTKFGWYMNLMGTNEQIVYNPELVQQAFTVNSIVPGTNSSTSCGFNSDTGWTYLINAMSGGAFNQAFLPPNDSSNSTYTGNSKYTDANAIGTQQNATGTSLAVTNSAGTTFLINETNSVPSGSGSIGSSVTGTNLPSNSTARPLSWVQRR